jgi:hypothetical protein
VQYGESPMPGTQTPAEKGITPLVRRCVAPLIRGVSIVGCGKLSTYHARGIKLNEAVLIGPVRFEGFRCGEFPGKPLGHSLDHTSQRGRVDRGNGLRKSPQYLRRVQLSSACGTRDSRSNRVFTTPSRPRCLRPRMGYSSGRNQAGLAEQGLGP